ncbi:kinase-like protein [Auricularia subglabra TFB-10046 SS5]|nr:kinase-like protein [Auricularia subglabra TFB-10046 SS5]
MAHATTSSAPSFVTRLGQAVWTMWWPANHADAAPMQLLPTEQSRRFGLLSVGKIRRSSQANPSNTCTTAVGTLSYRWTSRSVLLRHVEIEDGVGFEEGEFLRRLQEYAAGDIHSLLKLRHVNVDAFLGVCLQPSPLEAYTVGGATEGTAALDFIKDHPAIDRRRLVAQLARGLAYLHDKGIVHGLVSTDHILIEPDQRLLLSGIAVGLGCDTRQNEHNWIHSEVDEPEPEPPSLATMQLADDPGYEYQPYYVPDRVVECDGAVEVLVAKAARASLASRSRAGDIFAFGIAVVELFTGLSSSSSPSALRILRMALKSQRPPHPGRVCELRGLDEQLWDLCLRCWLSSETDSISSADITASLDVQRDDLLVCPAQWTLPELKAWVRSHIHNFGVIEKIDRVPPTRDVHGTVVNVRTTLRVQKQKVLAKVLIYQVMRRTRLQYDEDLYGEMIVWHQLRHPNVSQLLGRCSLLRLPAFVIDWTDSNCVDFLRDNPDADRLLIAQQVAAGLSYMHTRTPSVVHGDIRAHTIVFNTTGVARISNFDFGPEQDPVSSFDKSASFNVPCLRNSAPDFVGSRTGHRTTWSDVYSFAMFLYEIYAGHPPFHEVKNYVDLLVIVKSGRLPDRPIHPQLDDAIWDLMLLCWRHRPMSRPTMSQVYERLSAMLMQRGCR